MEAITEGVNNINITEAYKKNRIQVSNTKKPLFFYVNLAKVLIFLSMFVFFFFQLWALFDFCAHVGFGFCLILLFCLFFFPFFRGTCNSIMRSSSQHWEWVSFLELFSFCIFYDVGFAFRKLCYLIRNLF